MGVLVGIIVVLGICLILAMRYIISLIEKNELLNIENIELLAEIITVKEYNRKHKKIK